MESKGTQPGNQSSTQPQPIFRESDGEWNAWFVAPFLIGVGVGGAFGSLSAAGKPMYVGLILMVAGVAIGLAGVVLLRQLSSRDAKDDSSSNSK
ncbi:MAG: hypothetical protein WED34_06725 [Planctomycetales bacterium]